MTKTTSASPQPPKLTLTKQHHYVRTIASSFLGFIAVWLIISSILAMWLNHTLTNTNEYVKVVGPLASNPEVQNFVTTKATEALIDNPDAPVRDIATQVLPPEQLAAIPDEQLLATVRPVVQESVRSAMQSPDFAALWQNSNRTIHAELVSQLESESPTITLNFQPVIRGTVDLLGDTRLAFIKDKLQIRDTVGTVKIEGSQLDTMRTSYDYFQKALVAVLILAAIALTLAIVISVNHLKTFRRIALSIGISTALLAIAIGLLAQSAATNATAVEQKMGVALVESITHPLRLSLFITAGVCITLALGSKIYSVVAAKRLTAKQK